MSQSRVFDSKDCCVVGLVITRKDLCTQAVHRHAAVLEQIPPAARALSCPMIIDVQTQVLDPQISRPSSHLRQMSTVIPRAMTVVLDPVGRKALKNSITQQ